MNQFVTRCTVNLDSEQQSKLRRFLNLHYLGDEEVNYYDETGVLVPKHPEKETPEYIDATARAFAGHELTIELTFDITGIPTARILDYPIEDSCQTGTEDDS